MFKMFEFKRCTKILKTCLFYKILGSVVPNLVAIGRVVPEI